MNMASEAHRANTRCQRVITAVEIECIRLDKAGLCSEAEVLRRAVSRALRLDDAVNGDVVGDVPLRLASAIGGLGWLFIVLVVAWLCLGRP